ncbi:MAG: hypothetical protein JEY97_03700 [Bacteroidales bacterium]|nr:hypothetical protein [Bacteroidales bacterium]
MNIYRLTVLNDENDEFIREIEIKENQNFEDLHNFLKKSVNLKDYELSSFFLCNENWEKQEEIVLIDMNLDEKQEAIMPTHLMKNSIIKDFIKEENQRLIYEYDYLNLNTFFIECSLVLDGFDPQKKYPRCRYSKGQVFNSSEILNTDDSDKLREELLEEFTNLFSEDEDGDEF